MPRGYVLRKVREYSRTQIEKRYDVRPLGDGRKSALIHDRAEYLTHTHTHTHAHTQGRHARVHTPPLLQAGQTVPAPLGSPTQLQG